MQRDYAWHSARHAEDLEGAGGDRPPAGERAVARLGNVSVGPGKLSGDVRAARRRRPCSAISSARSPARHRPQDRASCWTGWASRSSPRGSPSTTIRCASAGLRSRAFDGEGLPVRAMDIVADGVLTTWLADSADARQLGIQPTGHAVRGVSGAPGAGPSNFYMAAGQPQPRGNDGGLPEGHPGHRTDRAGRQSA